MYPYKIKPLWVTMVQLTIVIAAGIATIAWLLTLRAQENAKQPGAQPGTTSNYYSIGGPAQHPYQTRSVLRMAPLTYCPLDELSRPTCAYGVLTTESRLQAKQRGRQDITVNPTGWPEKNQRPPSRTTKTVARHTTAGSGTGHI